jgi:uncharacterized membrane protein YeiH
MNAEQFSYLLGLAGTVAFSVTAVLAVTPKGIDIFGACVMGLITSIGGGTMRDVILNIPVFWATDLNYIWVALASSVVAFYGNRLMTRKEIYQLMLYVDGIGVSLFVIQAAHKVVGLDFAMPLGPILLGVLTAIGGGVLRDMLSGSPTLLMKKELYAVPLTIGVTLYMILLIQFPGQAVIIGTGCVVFTFAMRAAAIYWNLSVPNWMLAHAKNE